MELETIAVTWFEREDVPHWKQLDPGFDYEVWLKGTGRTGAALQAQGIQLVRVVVRPSEFTAWADERGLDYSSDNRRAYAAHVALYGQSVIPTVPPTRFFS